MNKKKNLTTKETFTLAVQNHQKNNLQVAEKLYKETLKTNPNHIETIFLLGSLSAQTNNFDKAKKVLKWRPKFSFDDLVKNMVENDLKNISK